MPMETQSSDENFEFKIFQVQLLLLSTIHKMERAKLLENPEKNDSGADVGPRSASEKLTRKFGSDRRDSESSTDIDRQNQRPRHEL